ncbi:MAG: hypothetical protein Q8J90_11045 [Gallionella sp.]|nr:hypothetical protein [Gallionella sp.]
MFIQWKKLAATLSAAILLCMSPAMVSAQDHGHSHGHAHDQEKPVQLTLNDGKKWATDNSLRQGMSRIRDALNAELPAIHSGKFTAAQYQALAQKVNDQLAFMVKNCRLEPKADAVLHLILADIIAGADIMLAQHGGEAHQGVVKIAHALENYASYFDHPGWQGLK